MEKLCIVKLLSNKKESKLCSMLRILTHDRSKWDGHGEKGKGHLKYGQIELKKLESIIKYLMIQIF